MRISHRHKFIFFSNPKTGSETVRNLLDPLSDVRDVAFLKTTPNQPFYSHMRPIEMKAAFRRFGWSYADYYSFVFIRNPWARLVSLYRYLQLSELKTGLDFGAWLRGTQPEGSGGGDRDDARWLKYGTYSLDAYAGDEDGNLLVRDVFRLEDIAGVPAKLRRHGIPIPEDAEAPWVNRRKEAADLPAFYTDKSLIGLVAERYAKEIAEYGYTYPA